MASVLAEQPVGLAALLLVGRPLPASRSAGIASGSASSFGAGGGDMSS